MTSKDYQTQKITTNRLGVCAAIFLVAAFTSCSSPLNRTQPRADDFSLSVSMEQHPSKDSWHLKYVTSQPVTQLIFTRQTNRFRSKNWKPLTPNVVIKEIDGQETILSSDGTPFNTAEFDLDSYYELTPKDYEFFQKFTDGSVVMYTGHLNTCPTNEGCETPVKFHFKTRKKNNIVVLGEISRESADWLETTPRGTYVYFGNIKPLARKHLTAIIDPNLPRWLRSRLFETLPKLFDLYTKQTDYPLTFKPFIFLNYSSEGKGAHSHGGTLPGLIQLSLAGEGWKKEDKDNVKKATSQL